MNARCAILLAYHNGAKYIEEQLNSLLTQEGVDVEIFISDDGSKPSDKKFLEELIVDKANVVLLNGNNSFGAAGKNFYYLIKEVCIDGFDYVAFCDQDDIWGSRKLATDVVNFKSHDVVALSSPTVPFNSKAVGAARALHKPQVKFDYVFESAGQGCTYSMTAKFFREFSSFVKERSREVDDIYFHDWLTYAYCRTRGYSWWFSDDQNVYYRQHDDNVIGGRLNAGGFYKRIIMLSSGWYFSQSRKLCGVLGDKFWCQLLDANNSMYSRLKSIYSIRRDCRRSPLESILICLFLLLYVIRNGRNDTSRRGA